MRARDWRPRHVAGIVARGRITGAAGMLPDTQLEYGWRFRDPKFEGDQFRVPVHIESVLRGRLNRGMLEARAALADLSILRWAKQRTTYPVFRGELVVLEQLYTSMARSV
jgi:hypothetical protein